MSSTRVTIKDAEQVFERLLQKTGRGRTREFAIHDPAREGTWDLDYNPVYGGVVITECVADSPPREGEDRKQAYTAEHHPLGYGRQSPREFCEFVERALRLGVERHTYRSGSHLSEKERAR